MIDFILALVAFCLVLALASYIWWLFGWWGEK